MPFFHQRRNEPRVEFLPTVAEPSRAELAGGSQIDREVVVAALDRLAGWARRRGNLDLVDLILDERAAIKPVRRAEVPVIPGRPS